LHHGLLIFYGVAFAGGQEEVGFEAVLAGVEVVVAAAEGEEFGVVAPFEDEAVFYD
jgi:hypothetical protein